MALESLSHGGCGATFTETRNVGDSRRQSGPGQQTGLESTSEMTRREDPPRQPANLGANLIRTGGVHN
jgi:hypothetical protein